MFAAWQLWGMLAVGIMAGMMFGYWWGTLAFARYIDRTIEDLRKHLEP